MPVALTDIQDGLGEALAVLPGVQVFDRASDVVHVPAAMVGLPDVDFDATMARGLDVYDVRVLVLVKRADADDAVAELETYLVPAGASNVKDAIEADRTLGGRVATLQCSGVREAGAYTVNAIDYLGAQWLTRLYG